ncbi:hypothetical protein DXG03_007758 [Asterophora parasitica]|uniref:alpha-1,2-Mannosidase n=1 Tax=Asterophora parasitica TaxID=117018 RepID=A0A9P7KFT6_9AGAR|nr:hypothetical protein DXG03_007758 [Asterophora parasitica]
MLPSHTGRPQGRPRIYVDPESGAPPKVNSFAIGRPLLRWLTWAVVCIVVLWMFGPFMVDIVRPPPPYSQMPYAPHEDAGHRPPLRPLGPALRPLPPPMAQPEATIWSARADKVRDAFIHAYDGYKSRALPSDELAPVSGTKVNNFNGWGVTVFDSLDTMWLMGLTDTFNDALEVVARSTFPNKPVRSTASFPFWLYSSYHFIFKDSFSPFFETVIRYLGGLLSAYALSGEPVLLARADDLGTMLLPAFNTTSGFPMYAVNTATGQTRAGWSGSVLWAEALSNQVEYKYLAHLTGRSKYYEAAERPMRAMYNAKLPGDKFPAMWNMETGLPSNSHFSVGAFADSAHEYLLKQWLLTGQSEPQTRDLYLRSVNAIIHNLLYLTPSRHLLYVTDTHNGNPTHTLEHLSCFLPGLLALGVHTLDLPSQERELHLWAAQGLARTCWATYADMPTGLGGDEVVMDVSGWGTDGAKEKGKWVVNLKEWKRRGRPGGVPPGLGDLEIAKEGKEREYRLQKTSYLLRPETVESFYILWRTTGDEVWRERGWFVFEAIEKHARTKYGYASITNVDTVPKSVTLLDEMPRYGNSLAPAPKLKYLYLLFTDTNIIPLEKWVFNTEAHPLPVFHWRKWEKEKYGIPL